MKEKILKWTKKLCLILVLTIFFLPILAIPTPKYQEWIYYPLPSHTLKTLSGEKINIPSRFPNQNYLILFFAEKSPTSLLQLMEISKISDKSPDQLAILLIHLGKINEELPISLNSNIHLLYDPNADFTRKMNIYTVPTLLLLTKEHLEVIRSQELVSSDQLLKYFTLERSRIE
ncbi:MAG: hypothetical protein KAX49_12220 [Halanaerobiales bacterium]|nr:hypothetical protein [Halanaerobiales bacterium]